MMKKHFAFISLTTLVTSLSSSPVQAGFEDIFLEFSRTWRGHFRSSSPSPDEDHRHGFLRRVRSDERLDRHRRRGNVWRGVRDRAGERAGAFSPVVAFRGPQEIVERHLHRGEAGAAAGIDEEGRAAVGAGYTREALRAAAAGAVARAPRATLLDLPEEMLIEIITRLDGTAAVRFLATCRALRRFTADQILWLDLLRRDARFQTGPGDNIPLQLAPPIAALARPGAPAYYIWVGEQVYRQALGMRRGRERERLLADAEAYGSLNALMATVRGRVLAYEADGRIRARDAVLRDRVVRAATLGHPEALHWIAEEGYLLERPDVFIENIQRAARLGMHTAIERYEAVLRLGEPRLHIAPNPHTHLEWLLEFRTHPILRERLIEMLAQGNEALDLPALEGIAIHVLERFEQGVPLPLAIEQVVAARARVGVPHIADVIEQLARGNSLSEAIAIVQQRLRM